MQKEAAGGRVSFELMGNTQNQQSFSLFHGAIWRTVSFQALPKRVLANRNHIIVLSLILLGMDAFNSYLYAQENQYFNTMAGVLNPMMY